MARILVVAYRRRELPVPKRRAASPGKGIARFILAAALAWATASCVDIDGGAVEASWDIRSHDGRGISDCSCTCPAIESIRFHLRRVRDGLDPCRGRAGCEFACQRRTGATAFDIPPGTYEISLRPIGAGGQDLLTAAPQACSVRTPAPILREVVRGQPTQLDAHLILSDCDASCAGGNNQKVCTSQ